VETLEDIQQAIDGLAPQDLSHVLNVLRRRLKVDVTDVTDIEEAINALPETQVSQLYDWYRGRFLNVRKYPSVTDSEKISVADSEKDFWTTWKTVSLIIAVLATLSILLLLGIYL